ncbi:hypothetical protein JHK87_044402 [Glycine soja]|nr:hypothetical protein JHK87_044402 [Glycine soja]
MSKSGNEIAVTEEAPPKESLPNLFYLFPKINLQLPFLPPKPQEPNPEAQAQQEGLKPSRVQFPKTQVVVPQEIGITSHQYDKELTESINVKVSQEIFYSIVREVVEEIGVPASSLMRAAVCEVANCFPTAIVSGSSKDKGIHSVNKILHYVDIRYHPSFFEVMEIHPTVNGDKGRALTYLLDTLGFDNFQCSSAILIE